MSNQVAIVVGLVFGMLAAATGSTTLLAIPEGVAPVGRLTAHRSRLTLF